MTPLGPGCGTVSNRLQADGHVLHAKFGPCVVWQLPGGRLPRNGEPLGIGGIVNHQRQEWTDVRRDWNRDATVMLAVAQFGVVLRGGEILEKRIVTTGCVVR